MTDVPTASPGHDSHEIAGGVEVEHDERQIVLAAHDDRRRVHDAQVVGEHLIERQRRIANGLRILDRIRRIHAVDLRRLDQDVGADLDGAQAGRRVGREERIAGAGREDRDAPLLEVAHGAAANVVLADLVDLQRRHDAHAGTLALERVLHRERVDDGREHAHLIGGHAIHAGFGEARRRGRCCRRR